MPWAKIDDRFYTNPKVVRAGRDARELYLVGLTYCAGELTNGAVPREVLPQLAVTVAVTVLPHAETCAARLVEVGLWEETAAGWQVHDYLKFNPTAEQVKREREATAKRVQEWRQKQSYIKEASNATGNAVMASVGNAVSTPDVTASPYPYPYQDSPSPTERGAPDADAPDAQPKPEPLRAVPKPKGLPLGPLADAFTAAGVAFPGARTGKEVGAAQVLLRLGTPAQIAACWSEILDGEYGRDFDQRRLSFTHLAGDRFFENWLLHQCGEMKPPRQQSGAAHELRGAGALAGMSTALRGRNDGRATRRDDARPRLTDPDRQLTGPAS